MAVSNNPEITRDMQAAFCQLLKVVSKSKEYIDVTPMTQINYGFVVVDKNNHLAEIDTTTFMAIRNEYGTDVRAFNQTFHKSFGTMVNTDIETLVAQQLMNYFSTYGLESMGLEAMNYVPVEKLDIPAEAMNVQRIMVIRQLEFDECVKLFEQYLGSLKAPNARILNAVKILLPYVNISVEDIASFEVQTIYIDEFNGKINNPITGLRYLIYKTTGKPMIIKNRKTIQTIKNQYDKTDLPARIFSQNMTGYASIFLRYKDLFLAFKSYPGCTTIINKLRRMADKYHKPLSDVAVQNFVLLVKQGRIDDVNTVLDKATNRELVKIYNFCCSRLAFVSYPAVYNIRNGKLFVQDGAIKPLSTKNITKNVYFRASQLVQNELENRLKLILSNRTFVLDDTLIYAAPTSEKQMTGVIPWGSYVSLENTETVVVGVQWYNGKERADIDLHLNGVRGHYGWNGGWNYSDNVIFTGDNTSAPLPEGAAEAFYCKTDIDEFIYSVNLYCGDENQDFKFFITKDSPELINKDYIFNANKQIAPPVKMNFNGERSINLGLLANNRFTFYGGSLTSSIVPKENYESAIDGLKCKMYNMLTVEQLLSLVHANVINKKEYEAMDEDAKVGVISLLPEDLTPSTLFDIVDGKI